MNIITFQRLLWQLSEDSELKYANILYKLANNQRISLISTLNMPPLSKKQAILEFILHEEIISF